MTDSKNDRYYDGQTDISTCIIRDYWSNSIGAWTKANLVSLSVFELFFGGPEGAPMVTNVM